MDFKAYNRSPQLYSGANFRDCSLIVEARKIGCCLAVLDNLPQKPIHPIRSNSTCHSKSGTNVFTSIYKEK